MAAAVLRATGPVSTAGTSFVAGKAVVVEGGEEALMDALVTKGTMAVSGEGGAALRCLAEQPRAGHPSGQPRTQANPGPPPLPCGCAAPPWPTPTDLCPFPLARSGRQL
jgi:hypothetical protein